MKGAGMLAVSCLLLAVGLPAAAQDPPPAVAVVPADSASAAQLDTLDLGDLQLTTLKIEEVDLWDTGVNPTGAVLMTPLFPGWGQLYADNSWRGALAFGLEMFYWTNILSKDRQAVRARDFGQRFESGTASRKRYDAIAEENWEQMRDYAWWSGGVLLIIALDAYVGAHLFNFDEDPVPVPDRWEEQFGPPGGDMPGGQPAAMLTVFQWRKTF